MLPQGDEMGFTQKELDAGLTAAIDAMFRLLPGLRAAFESFKPPAKAPPNAPMDQARAVLEKSVTLLDRLHAGERLTDVDLGVLTQALRVPAAWYEGINYSPTRCMSRPFGNVLLFAAAVKKLARAHQLISQRCWEGNRDLSDAWSQIGNLLWDRTDVLVVTGSANYSEGIRRRAQEALEKVGATGGWWVYTIDAVDKWKFDRHGPVSMLPDRDDVLGIPPGLYADKVYDPESDRSVLPEERGHDTLPALT